MYIISCKYIICELFEMDNVLIGYVIVFFKNAFRRIHLVN